MLSRLDTSRTQVVGSLAIVGVVALWALALPFINSLVEGENPFKAGEPYDLGGGASIVPLEGWSLDASSSEGVVTIMRKGAGTFTVVAGIESDQPIEDALQLAIDGFAGDPSGTHWETGGIVTFETDRGAPGGSVTAHSTTDANSTWIIDDGVRSVTALGGSSETTWPSLGPEMDTMARSVDLYAATESEATETP